MGLFPPVRRARVDLDRLLIRWALALALGGGLLFTRRELVTSFSSLRQVLTRLPRPPKIDWGGVRYMALFGTLAVAWVAAPIAADNSDSRHDAKAIEAFRADVQNILAVAFPGNTHLSSASLSDIMIQERKPGGRWAALGFRRRYQISAHLQSKDGGIYLTEDLEHVHMPILHVVRFLDSSQWSATSRESLDRPRGTAVPLNVLEGQPRHVSPFGDTPRIWPRILPFKVLRIDP